MQPSFILTTVSNKRDLYLTLRKKKIQDKTDNLTYSAPALGLWSLLKLKLTIRTLSLNISLPCSKYRSVRLIGAGPLINGMLKMCLCKLSKTIKKKKMHIRITNVHLLLIFTDGLLFLTAMLESEMDIKVNFT